jgi:predicted  nucleic acid-binding Zn-ribbon protein
MTNNNIRKVIDLHKIDKRLLDINSKRGDLPLMIESINKKIVSFSKQDKDFSIRLEEIEKRKVIINGDLADQEKKISSLNEQMYKVKSNKEYEALLNEIDHLNKENDNNLSELETFDQEVKSINESLDNNNQELESLNAKLLKSQEKLNSTNALIEKEEGDLAKNRVIIEKDLSAEENLLETYNSKKEEYDGIAFALINRGCCEHCYSSLPPQLEIDASSCNQFVTCPTCSILLYVDKIDVID